MVKVILVLLCCILNRNFLVYSSELDLREALRMEKLFCSNAENCFADKYGVGDPVSAPYQSLIPVQPPKHTLACCENDCSCNLDTCIELGTCCPDAGDAWPTFTLSKEKMTCNYPQLRPFSRFYPNANLSVQMFSKCPDSFDTGSDVFHKCEGPELVEEMDMMVPVTDIKSWYTYKNGYCALCHNISRPDLIKWVTKIECFRGVQEPPKSSHEVIASNKCNVIFVTPDEMAWVKSVCPVISECNVTGHWKKYDSFIEAACMGYTRIFKQQYRNVFCFFCNIDDKYPPFKCDEKEHIMTLTDILKERELRPKVYSCGINQIHDPVRKICYELMCKYPKKIQNGRCVYKYEYIGGTTYVLYLEFVPSEMIQSSAAVTEAIKKTIRTWMRKKMGEQGRIFLDIKAKLNSSDSTIADTKYFVIVVRVTFDILPPYKTDIIDYMLSVTGLSMEMSVSGKLVKFTMRLRAYQSGFKPPLYDPTPGKLVPIYKDPYQKKFPHVLISVLYGCPFVKLVNIEYHFTLDQQVLTIESLNATVDAKEVLLVGSPDSIEDVYMCVHTYERVMRPYIEYDLCDEKVPFQSILSLVCISISLAFALVTLFFYLRFKRLKHTQPGINNIILCVALVIAQVLFQSGDPCVISEEACKIMGIFIHFSWLFLIFWMNICCIHMVRVFRFTQFRQTFYNTSKTTFIYFLYSFSASLILVLINIIAALSRSNGIDIGYGGTSSCYINDSSMIAYAFALPVAAIVVINIILFIIVMAQLKNVPKVQNDKDERNFIHIYARLSTLTGGTWLFGFASFFLNVEVLDYIFILLNAPQGLFLFFAFVANKRTLKTLFKKDQDDRVTTKTVSTYKHG